MRHSKESSSTSRVLLGSRLNRPANKEPKNLCQSTYVSIRTCTSLYYNNELITNCYKLLFFSQASEQARIQNPRI